jgi:ssDNA-binding Zn-finger/Zn-ribbon topoisomerase 1
MRGRDSSRFASVQTKTLTGGTQMEGYCLKDKRRVEIKDPQTITMKNGKPATIGTCPICGTKIYRIGKSPAGYVALPGEPSQDADSGRYRCPKCGYVEYAVRAGQDMTCPTHGIPLVRT